MSRVVICALLLCLAGPAASRPFAVQSPAERVNLVELYTSEGCSSCPPAERWLAGLESKPGLWQRFVPLAFHVDYWDYLGWRDRFADPAYTNRQRAFARQGLARAVYTPAVFLNGEEWRGWHHDPGRLGGSGERAGPLRLVLDGAAAALEFIPKGAPVEGALAGHLALLGSGLSTNVEGGENSGRRLVHGFVVLAYATGPLTAADGAHRGRLSLGEPRAEAPRAALVGWVTRRGRGRVLQAAGGWLER